MSKPSEKINEIYEKMFGKEYATTEKRYDIAIIMYLDEEWEKRHNHPEGSRCQDC